MSKGTFEFRAMICRGCLSPSGLGECDIDEMVQCDGCEQYYVIRDNHVTFWHEGQVCITSVGEWQDHKTLAEHLWHRSPFAAMAGL